MTEQCPKCGGTEEVCPQCGAAKTNDESCGQCGSKGTTDCPTCGGSGEIVACGKDLVRTVEPCSACQPPKPDNKGHAIELRQIGDKKVPVCNACGKTGRDNLQEVCGCPRPKKPPYHECHDCGKWTDGIACLTQHCDYQPKRPKPEKPQDNNLVICEKASKCGSHSCHHQFEHARGSECGNTCTRFGGVNTSCILVEPEKPQSEPGGFPPIRLCVEALKIGNGVMLIGKPPRPTEDEHLKYQTIYVREDVSQSHIDTLEAEKERLSGELEYIAKKGITLFEVKDRAKRAIARQAEQIKELKHGK